MKFKCLAWIFIFSIFIIFVSSILTNEYIAFNFNILNKTNGLVNINGNEKDIVNYIVTVVGFVLTALGFGFVVFQVSALATQINKQEEQYHKDSEFRNFLEATKMLTSVENKNNSTAQISAMYLLYDFARKYPNNIEKVIKVLNKYATPAIYQKNLIYTLENSNINLNSIISDKKIINEWKEYGEPYQKSAITALEINKKLFVYAIEHKIKINLSDIIIFDLDIEKDFNKKSILSLFIVTNHSPRITFLWCNFSNGNKRFNFSTGSWYSRINLSKKSVKGRLDISLSYFINCDLTECNFSSSNLWGVIFESCKLNYTKFNDAECSGSEFTNSKISDVQLKEMLFIDKFFFEEFRNNKKLKYAVVYPNNENCFSNRAEYEKFVYYKNTTKLKVNDNI